MKHHGAFHYPALLWLIHIWYTDTPCYTQNWLPCDIEGAKEPGMMDFPTKWGAKEHQNPQNHGVVGPSFLVSCFNHLILAPQAATVLIKPTSGLPDWKGHMVSPNYFRVINASIHTIVFLGCAVYAMDLVTNKPLGKRVGRFFPWFLPRNQVKGGRGIMIEIHNCRFLVLVDMLWIKPVLLIICIQWKIIC